MSALQLSTLWSNINAAPAADFLVQADRRSTYGDLRKTIIGILALFDVRGVTAGSRVLIVTANEFVAISTYIAALLDGAVPVMLTPATPSSRVAAIRELTGPSLVLCDAARKDESWAHGATPVHPWRPANRGFLGIRREQHANGPQSELALPDSARQPRLPASLDELAYILFTSGTTQEPSGVMLSRKNLLANVATISCLFGITPDARIFNDMILAHGDGLVQGPLLAIANGCALIRQGGYSLSGQEAWLNALRTNRATHVITVPTVWSMIDRYATHDDYFDAPEFQALLSVAARLDPALWTRLENRFARPVFNQYGLTETVASALYAGNRAEMGAVGTIGRPVDCMARIERREAHDVALGELQLKGDNIFMGYWGNAERTAASFTPDGWFRTGDLVEQRPEGSFQFLGRLKSAIMTGGFLIRPEEIDEVLLAHPAVSQSITVGMPDPEFEEVPMTAVVLDRPVDEGTLAAHCRQRLEPLKVPKRIVAVESIPRGDSGKARIAEVRTLIANTASVIHAQGNGSTEVRIERTVLELASRVFRTDSSSLDRSMTPEHIDGWDSFSHLNLILAAEAHFGITISASRVAGIRTLGDLISAIETS